MPVQLSVLPGMYRNKLKRKEKGHFESHILNPSPSNQLFETVWSEHQLRFTVVWGLPVTREICFGQLQFKIILEFWLKSVF